MLSILLLILKILGLILVAVVMLVLLCIGLVLFVPLRYRLSGQYHGSLIGEATLTWLFHLLRAQARYDADGLNAELFVCGFRIWHTHDEKEEVEETLSEAEGELVRELEEDEQLFAQSVMEQENVPLPEREPKPQKKLPQKEEKLQKKVQNPPQKAAEPKEEPSKPKKPGILARIRNKIQSTWERTKSAVRRIRNQLKAKTDRLEAFKKWFQDEKHQASIRFLIRQFKRLLAHILPRSGTIHIRFGLDDPYYTGQILAAASPFYGIYGRFLELEPDFTEAVFSMDGKVGGRIRLSYLLWIAFQVWRDKDTWKMIRKLRK